MIIPRDQRGKIKTSKMTYNHDQFSPAKNNQHHPLVSDGTSLVEALVAKHRLPQSLGFNVSSSMFSRAFHNRGNIRVGKFDKAATVAHEIGHAIEFSHEDVQKKSARFLFRRANGENKTPLRNLYPNRNFRPNEYTLKDEFEKRGGSHYAGKIYMPNYSANMQIDEFVKSLKASEILSMGIQRMIESPVEFKRNDPDYFNFVKSQIK